MNEKIMLVDGNSIINRAFYGIPILTNKDGLYTNAVYGFLNILFKLIDEEKPTHIAICFDVPKPTFRHEKFADYKGTRKGMPDELREQLPTLKQLLTKMNIKMFELEGFEADDLLGTLCAESLAVDVLPVVISGDRDLLQLATDVVKIRIPKTKAGKTEVEDYYAQNVVEKYGVTPQQFIEVKALMGDASDNVPGVPGIGEKTAVKIIQQYESVEQAIEHAADVKPKKASENLVEFREQAILSKELVTIITNAPITFIKEETLFANVFNADAYEMFKALEFKSMLTRFENENKNKKADSNAEAVTYHCMGSRKEAADYVDALAKQSEPVAYQIVQEDNQLLGISFSHANDRGTLIRVGDEMRDADVIEMTKPFFESEAKKIAHDAKKDIVFLKKYGITLKQLQFDTMIAGYILNATNDTYAYNDIAYDFLQESFLSEEELFGKGKSKKKIADLSEAELTDFACRQSDISFRASGEMMRKLSEHNQDQLYFEIELPLIHVLADMEMYGIKIDKPALTVYGEELSKHIEQLTTEIYWLAGEEFNINSPKQMGVILFEKLGLKGGKKTKTGYSTSVEVLEPLKSKHEIVDKILDYRTYVKLKSTYVDGLLNVMDAESDKVYSTFNQAITATGRISSTEPNLQNIPIKIELGRRLRKCFIPTNDEYVFVDADYSQIELRVLAHMSQDETLINAFKEGQDIHRLTASQVFHIPFEMVNSNQRSNAKAVNFGIVYGMGGFSLSQDLGITKKEADRYIEGYFEKYPMVKVYLDETVARAKQTGFAETIFHRRRQIPELNASNFMTRAFGERIAMNMPVQGSAADIIKIAMVKVGRRLKEENMKSTLILQVHDELLVEAQRDEVDKVKEILAEEMAHAVTLLVPIDIDVHEGNSWYEAH